MGGGQGEAGSSGSRVDGSGGEGSGLKENSGLELAFACEEGIVKRFFYRAIKRPPSVSAPECRLEARQGYHGDEELLLTAKAGRKSEYFWLPNKRSGLM